MLTVMELLSFPLFRSFRLVSGYGGLYNQVKGTGILEWESSSDVEKNFEEGEFVVTTLSMSRSDAAQAEQSIRTLIDKRVSAVAVKEIYYHEISDDLKAYSDACSIPIFFFSETFFDDIIYTIKNTLLTHRREFDHSETIGSLLDAACTPEQKRKKAREINPFFHPCFICCFGLPAKNTSWQKLWKAPRLNPEETVYSILEYKSGVLVIYTVKSASSDLKPLEDSLLYFLEKSGLVNTLSGLGISNPAKGLENLGVSIQESMYANNSCLSKKAAVIRFRDTGLDQILLPMSDSDWTRKFYESHLSKVSDYDTRHGSRLMETLLAYVESGGDMNATARTMFQHSNTIRYRIERIRKLLNLEDNEEAQTLLQIFVRLHKIYTDSDVV